MLVAGQALEGVPWGIFIANSPAYASEVVPLALRAACTATLQMSWSIGGIIVAGATYGFNKRKDEWSWRIPLALQWIFPTPLLALIFLAPESPWWLVRRGRREEALRSLQRLDEKENAPKALAMIERTVQIEAQQGGEPTLLDLVKGTDLRRTLITCLMYASQNFAGNLIANQATFFFEQAGISPDRSFQLNLINSCLQLVANTISWPLLHGSAVEPSTSGAQHSTSACSSSLESAPPSTRTHQPTTPKPVSESSSHSYTLVPSVQSRTRSSLRRLPSVFAL